MKKLFSLLLLWVLFSSHDMYLKLDTYFLEPNTAATIVLFNGTFDKSDNTIDRNRMIDVSLVGNGERISVDTTQWSEKDGATLLDFITGKEGTWVAGVSTRPRNIEMTAEKFNEYLKHDGVLDMLTWREENNALDQNAIEKYSKHVKTIFQVGNKLTTDWQTQLGYPIEFIPLENPYDVHEGHNMPVQLLWQGKPLANQLVYVGSKTENHSQEHSHEASEEHHHDNLTKYRTDAEGKFKFPIAHKGIWYLRTIYLTASEEEGLTHESNWATLTFEVGEGHSHSHHEGETHSHHHEHEGIFGLPSYAFWIASVLIVAVLFIWFNRRKG